MMIYVVAALIGLIVAVVRGVAFSTIAEVRFRALGFAAMALGLRVLLNTLAGPADVSWRLMVPPLPGILPLGSILNLAAFGCALAFVYANRRLPGFNLILVGLALNVVVMLANGGRMPGDPGQLATAGLLQGQLDHAAKGLWSPYSVIGPNTPLSPLADVIYVSLPFSKPTVASIGDLIIALGVAAFFNPLPRRKVAVPQA